MNRVNQIGKTINEHLEAAVKEGVFPGAVLLAAAGSEIRCLTGAGFKSIEPAREPIDLETVFDLASLTKPLTTGIAVMKLVDQGRLDLDEPVHRVLELRPARNREEVTSRMLLGHCGGFPAWEPFYRRLSLVGPSARRSLLRALLWELPQAYPPGTKSLYSDPGYMLLEWVIEKCSGQSLAEFANSHYRSLGLKRTYLGHNAKPQELDDTQFAATERCPWRKRIVRGDVHDENAYILDGWSGHAGLFGTASEVYLLARHVIDHYLGRRCDWIAPDTARRFLARDSARCPGSHVLGWDTPTVGCSSSGRYFSRNTVGHLGFTGTSLWIDLGRDIIVLFLTNRVHPTRANEKIRLFRPFIHDAVFKEILNLTAS
ncbi:MAG TPA: class A beta-lactamase-related serine hydrolase [Desulfobacteraceae bacterium]|nr:class A beta-lactamase-related serine hydrolase [Desulfobacteraceae bacterium]